MIHLVLNATQDRLVALPDYRRKAIVSAISELALNFPDSTFWLQDPGSHLPSDLRYLARPGSSRAKKSLSGLSADKIGPVIAGQTKVVLSGLDAHRDVLITALSLVSSKRDVVLAENAIGDWDTAAMRDCYRLLEKYYRDNCKVLGSSELVSTNQQQLRQSYQY